LEACHYLGVNVFMPSFEGMMARLLIGAGRLGEARDRVNAGLQLAEETGMHYYDAELLRLRSHTDGDTEARRTDLDSAMELACEQGAIVFEMRAAIDDFELRGEPVRNRLVKTLGRLPDDSPLPEAVRARALIG
jgi:predicted ATPase